MRRRSEYIDWTDPVDWDCPVNYGLLSWHLVGDEHPYFGGSISRDLTGRFNGVLTNGPSWKTGGQNRITKRGLDYESGASQYVDLGTTAALGLTKFTLAAWVNPESFANTNVIVTRANSAGGSNYRNYNFDIQATGTLRLYYTTGPAGFHGLDPSTVTLSASVWSHVIGSYDGATLRIYVNGLPAGTAATSFVPDTATDVMNCCIGRMGSSASSYFDGLIDDVRIYNWGYGDGPALQLYHESRQGYPNALRRLVDMKYTEQAAAPTFQAAWAHNANVLITPGII